jgi:hypothetical protein
MLVDLTDEPECVDLTGSRPSPMSTVCREAQSAERASDFMETVECAARLLRAPVDRLEARLSTMMVCSQRRREETILTLRVMIASSRGRDSLALGQELLPRLALLHMRYLADNGTEGVDPEFAEWLDRLITRCPLAARHVRDELELGAESHASHASPIRSTARPRRRPLETLPPPRATFSPSKRDRRGRRAEPTKRRKLVRMPSGTSATISKSTPINRRVVVPGSPIRSRRISSVAIPETP